MIKAAVLGSPISHSLSPKIHAKAYEILEIAADYQAIELDVATFPAFFAENSGGDWNGFSLTMPLKEIVLQVAAEVDVKAKRISSANTLYRDAEKWRVTSTDLLAFENLISISSGAKVAIIGGGGTARAAAGALNSKVDAFDVLLRSPERLIGLASAAPDARVRLLEMSHSLNEYDLIIQTTPAGAFDAFANSLTSASGILFESLYKPSPTALASKYLTLGGQVIGGKELLVEQALFQIERFSQVKFDFGEMRTALLQHIAGD